MTEIETEITQTSAEMSTSVHSLGNTNPVSKDKVKRVTESKLWFFTWNNYTQEDILSLKNNPGIKKYCFQEETGAKGTPHLQGVIETEFRCRPMEKLKLPKTIHWEKCKDIEAALNYCKKEDTRTGKRFIKGYPDIPKILDDYLLFDWEKKILELIQQEPDDRSIYWYWNEKGCNGKTTFTKYLCQKYDAVPLNGKKNDILYLASIFYSKIYVFDLPRCSENTVPYAAMEDIKNGLFVVGKYESKPVIRDCPHIIVFANFEPDESKLSSDRWRIFNI